MNIFGIGTLEILLIMLIAFIFLGPEKMIAGAKKLGQLTRGARNLSSNFNSLILDEQDKNTENITKPENNEGTSSLTSTFKKPQAYQPKQTPSPKNDEPSDPSLKSDQ